MVEIKIKGETYLIDFNAKKLVDKNGSKLKNAKSYLRQYCIQENIPFLIGYTTQEFIRKNVSQKPGVYIWYDAKNQEVLYIGMAGKIKTNGELTNHPISQRLQAPRIKDFETKKDITTNRFIPAVLELFGLEEIEFHILPCKENEPAAYVESILLYNYFKAHGVLPILNNAF